MAWASSVKDWPYRSWVAYHPITALVCHSNYKVVICMCDISKAKSVLLKWSIKLTGSWHCDPDAPKITQVIL